jgi:hypothetical protein
MWIYIFSTLMEADSKLVKETLEGSPELYKDLLYTDDSGKYGFQLQLLFQEKEWYS